MLDLGCGTGLCGTRLRQYARTLVGVDLSSAMLQHACGKGIYDDLVHGELTQYLHAVLDAYDVIVAADTLVYFGALDDVLAASASALRRPGVFVFTLEEAIDPASTLPYDIQPHGRYNHRAEYVERLLERTGWQVAIDRAELRKEYGVRSRTGTSCRRIRGDIGFARGGSDDPSV